jgi:hypothetical protein
MEDDFASQYRVYHSFHPVYSRERDKHEKKMAREEIPTLPID